MCCAAGSVLLMTCMNEAYLKGSHETIKRGGSMNKRYSAFFKFGLPDNVGSFLEPLGWEVAERELITLEDAHKVCIHHACLLGQSWRSHFVSSPCSHPSSMCSASAQCCVWGKGVWLRWGFEDA